MWTWLFKLGSPKTFYELSDRYLPWLAGTSAVLVALGLVWGLVFAPPDYQMGHNYRIVYIHATTASIGMGAYAMMALLSAAVLIWRIKLADMMAKAVAPIGAGFTALCLASGSLWGIPTWGTWWIWDARLTSTLILFFIYVGVIALRGAFDSQDAAARATAVLTLVGVVNLPIIHYSVVWWNTLHQVSSDLAISPEAPNPPEVWLPAVFMGLGLFAFFLLVVTLRTRNEILLRERRSQWVTELVLRRAA